MLRGFITVHCPKCGHKFKAPDIEEGATVRSCPVTCPSCGHQFRPKQEGLLERLKDIVLEKRRETI